MPANKPPVFPKIIIAVFLAVAVLMLAIAAILAIRSGLALAKEAVAPGSVVGLVVRTDQTGNEFYTILYPFVESQNGYEVELSDRHWVEFGRALKRIHAAVTPPALTRRIQLPGLRRSAGRSGGVGVLSL